MMMYNVKKKFGLLIIVIFIFFQKAAFAQCSSAPPTNLITNGNFEGTVTGNESGYTYVASGANGPGTWGVSLPVSSGSSYVAATMNGKPADASGNSNGHYMLIDANGTKLAAWQSQSITVTAGTTYFFSAWIANINKNYTNPSILNFAINGTVISPTEILADSADHNWSQYYTSWLAPSNETITLSLINENGTGTGNDMGLDNITFSTSCAFVEQLKTSELPAYFYDCNGSAATLNSEIPASGTTFSWTRDGVTVTSAIGPSLTTGIGAAALGTYVICYVTAITSCAQSDTVQVVDAAIAITEDTISPTKCGDDGTIELEGLAAGSSYTVNYTKGGPVTVSGLTPNAKGIINLTGTAGTYSNIQVSNAYGCSSNKVAATLTDPTPMTISFNGTTYPAKSSCTANWDVRIYGVLDNTVQLVDTNGVGNYIQSNSSSTPYIEFSSLGAGTYIFTVTDTSTNCTSNSLPLTLKNEDQPTITAVGTGPSCPPSNNGVITISGDTIEPNKNYDLNYYLNGVAMIKVTVTSTNTSPAQIIWTVDHSGAGLTGGSYTNITVGPSSSCASNPVAVTLASCPLPVKLVNFNAKQSDDMIAINWQTASEINNNYFVLERSSDGVNFTPITKVKGADNSSTLLNYSFNDPDPLDGINYYRLEQVDYNEDITYSTIIAVEYNKASVTIYPNPNEGTFTISYLHEQQTYAIEITDMEGKSIYTNSITKMPATIELSDVPPGMYIVRLQLNEGIVTRKLIII